MDGILLGLTEVFQFWNLLALFAGVSLGLIVGCLPGLNDNITMAILVPLTFGLDPQIGILLLIGVYCSACFGGSFPAILLKIPGTASSVVTTFDGYPMVQKGEAGTALGISTISSVFGGIVSALILLTLAPFLASQALKFGPAEYFSLVILGLSTIIGMTKRELLLKSIIVTVIGLVIATVGMSPQTGYPRFSMGISNLTGGIPLIPLLIGLFGVSSVLEMSEELIKGTVRKKIQKVKRIIPSRKLIRRLLPTMTTSSLLGSIIGVIPGAGMIMAIYLAYDQAMRMNKDKKEQFGKGIPEGVAAPEAANNAVVAGSMVPLVSLGVPGNSASVIFLGGLMIHGLRPGPALFEDFPEIAYLLIVGFLVAYFFVFPLGILMAKFLVGMILRIPRSVLSGVVLLLCVTGAFAVRNNPFDVWVAILFGVIGFAFGKLNLSYAPLVLAVVLGPLLEMNYQQSMVLSGGSLAIFFQKPLSLVFLIVAAFFVVTPFISRKKKVAPGG